MLDFSKLQTPPGDGDVLVEPSGPELTRMAEWNHELLRSYSFAVLDRDVQTLRRELRDALCAGCDAPTILTGHQPDFIHAGVWAKHVVASQLARSFDGRAINFVVDSDAPQNTVLPVPEETSTGYAIKAVPYARIIHGAAHESIGRIEAEELRSLEDTLRRCLGPLYERSCLPTYFSTMAECGPDCDWVDQMVTARRTVERTFGVEMIEHRVSRTWLGPLLAEWLVNAPRFRECYNDALADYRRTYRVRSAHRPIPDLFADGRRCEAPVWVYRLGEPRRRLFVERVDDRLVLYADNLRIGDADITRMKRWELARTALQQVGGYVFRPRALALTLWARVLVGDLFIHGIGGAKYDRITDGLIRRYFRVEPPAMACVSATLWTDLARDDVDAAAVRHAIALLRDARCNPQRHLTPTPATRTLLDQRARAVARSIELRRSTPRDRSARRAVFHEIRVLTEALNAADPSAVQAAEHRAQDVAWRWERNQLARRRDFFFAMLDRDRLQRLRDRLASRVGRAL